MITFLCLLPAGSDHQPHRADVGREQDQAETPGGRHEPTPDHAGREDAPAHRGPQEHGDQRVDDVRRRAGAARAEDHLTHREGWVDSRHNDSKSSH